MTQSQIEEIAGQVKPTIIPTAKFVKAKKLSNLEDYRKTIFN